VVRSLKSVTRYQCDARPTVTFPAAERHRSLTGTKLYYLVTGAHECEQLEGEQHMNSLGCVLLNELLNNIK